MKYLVLIAHSAERVLKIFDFDIDNLDQYLQLLKYKKALPTWTWITGLGASILQTLCLHHSIVDVKIEEP